MRVERAAKRFLTRLANRLAVAGLTATAATPALLAAVDQHAAAVRDIVAYGVEGSAAVAGSVLLASYARGVLDHAREKGWRFPQSSTPVVLAETDWITLRLMAVCALARTLADTAAPHRRPSPAIE